MKIENRLLELGIQIPESSPPGALYVPVKQVGNILFVSGQIPAVEGKPKYTGKLMSDDDLEYGQAAARLCITNMLAALKFYLGDLDKVANIIKLQAFVSSGIGFDKQHLVANAASQLLIDVFGEAGKHARTAVGTNQLPMDVTVEIEAIVEIREEN